MASHKSFNEAQLLIDEEIADLTVRMRNSIRLLKIQRNAAIRVLKTRRNELAPALKLPEEIIVQIFIILRDTSDRHPKSWHQVTHICRYWRGAAIGWPALWARLYNPPHALAALMLERSQSMLLDVSLSTLEPKHSIQTLTIILGQIERIRSLSFRAMPPTFLDIVHDVLANLGRDWKAASLQSLAVGLEPGPRPVVVRLALDVFRPTGLLRCLSLSGGRYDLAMLPLVPNLTALYLYGKSLRQITGVEFTEALRHMQFLEILKIDWKRLHLRQFPPTSQSQPIHLPCLRELEIVHGHQDHFDSFLSLMAHPNLHQLSISSPDSVNNLGTFIQSLVSTIETGDFSPLQYLRVEDEYFTLSARPESSYWLGSLLHMYVPIDDDAGEDDRGFQFVVDIISSITPFDNPDKIPLRYIYLADFDAPVDQFTRLFAPLRHLETIEVYHKLALVLFKALHMASGMPRTSILFPKLQCIICHGVYPTLSSDVFNELHDSLLSRQAQIEGAVPFKLELVGCKYLDESQANQLEEIGVEVVIR
ncbi:hypothetical protein D9619_010046 [Psilocybe cf. subviscida]|uniref:F-box domain-containing protein n=1 Tax=Psilocybe cf. subviscida TaxID=2480587 RepID=A0A8H5BL87_9AGAR|nr:hypothetical protein D9619_010046 [Psilocybe cf. subviscida]